MMRIVYASSNKGKCTEIANKLQGNFEVIPQSTLGVVDIIETGLTFVENAILKARNACKHTELPCIADDSGLVVEHLNGAPGLYSARYSGPDANEQKNIDKVLTKLNGITNRAAYFYCALVYLKKYNDPAPKVIIKTWHGDILKESVGIKGFGYDPIFWVPTHNVSAAELDLTTKNTISHRGQALTELTNFLLPAND
ncbi:MAG: RdgB/HAM1 family non-canonical purine NTP pyrophosphatase [Francisellaceae bacterium]|nr:RdgB/HAM1 family non-canonical purine NTP pyrophosphatase [Francisellaceae bacterium]